MGPKGNELKGPKGNGLSDTSYSTRDQREMEIFRYPLLSQWPKGNGDMPQKGYGHMSKGNGDMQ